MFRMDLGARVCVVVGKIGDFWAISSRTRVAGSNLPENYRHSSVN